MTDPRSPVGAGDGPRLRRRLARIARAAHAMGEISDDELKAELEAIQPVPPVADPADHADPPVDGRRVLAAARDAGIGPTEALALIVVDAIGRHGFPAPLLVVAQTLGVEGWLVAKPLRMLVRRGLVRRTHLEMVGRRTRAFTTTPNGTYLAAALQSAGRS